MVLVWQCEFIVLETTSGCEMKGRGHCHVKVYLGLFLVRGLWEVRLVWVTHRVFEWRAGFINLRQPSTREFGGHSSLRSVTYAHAAKSDGFSILTFHCGGHGSTKTALHHEVLLPAALLPVAGVQRIFSCHHGGKWEQTGLCLTGHFWITVWICKYLLFRLLFSENVYLLIFVWNDCINIKSRILWFLQHYS